MSETPQDRCSVHHVPLITGPEGALRCVACVADTVMPQMPESPMSSLAQGAAGGHELVVTYQAAGFSRSEAVQIFCCIIQAGIMKGSGG